MWFHKKGEQLKTTQIYLIVFGVICGFILIVAGYTRIHGDFLAKGQKDDKIDKICSNNKRDYPEDKSKVCADIIKLD